MFKMRIFSFCLPPDGVDDLYQEISLDIELPYIPRSGDLISMTPYQDFVFVDEVFFAPHDENEFGRISVHTDVPDTLGEFEKYVAEGWVSA